jgi:glycosyltransferase involved in cell wall biosynthesis
MTLLAICIPTFNRAEMLRSALYSIAPQIQEFSREVELIVSDNNSTDNTEEVVMWAQQLCPIQYHRNTKNIGATNNFILLTTQLAKSDYCWLLGDDDFILPGAIKKVLDILKKHPEIDYAYVNNVHCTTEILNKYPHPVSSSNLPKDLPLGNGDPNEYYIERWEILIDPNICGVFLGGIQSAVIRRSIWCKFAPLIYVDNLFANFDSVYGQTIIYANGLIGKKAYYIGTPYVVVVDGVREWIDLAPKISILYLHKILDLYEHHGVDPEQIERCRKFLVKWNSGFIVKAIFYNSISGISRSFALRYVIKYWKYLGLQLVVRIKNTIIGSKGGK